MSSPIKPISQKDRMKSMSPADRERWIKKRAQFTADSSAIEGIPLNVEKLETRFKRVFSK